jgi:cytochrome c-type biogenesis protein CcmH/NrfG
MSQEAKKHIPLKNVLVLSILLASVVSYVCIFNLMQNSQQATIQELQKEQDKKEVSLPEVEIMKTVLEKARDVFTIMSSVSSKI